MDSKAFLTNVIFDNFKLNYAGNLASKCNSNFVFRPHSGASDFVGSHNLFNCSCTNCDASSYVLCD